MRSLALATTLLLALAALPAHAASVTYLMNMTGDQEVPGPGDPDGIATGSITLDDVTGEISWSFTYANIAAPTAMHIHTGGAGASGGVFIGLGVSTSGGAGTLIDSLITSTTNIDTLLANPTGFYVNVHNGDFGAGAVRGQLGTIPEPASAALLGLGLGAIALRRRS